MTSSRLLPAVALGAGLLTSARGSGAAAPAQAYTVFWQADTSLRSGLDDFYACLTEGSSFSPTWAGQFGVSSVSYRGSYVLTSKLPAAVRLETDLRNVMTDAFNKGLVPPPAFGSLSEYILYIPSSTIVSDNVGDVFCQKTTDPCGVHQQASFNGVQYQYAAVPLNCTCHDPPAPSKLDDSARVGEHELAEGLADLGTARYEVGDQCKTPRNTIACCGHTYEIQPLAGPNGIAVCQDLTASGSPAACAMNGGAGGSGGSSGSDSGSDSSSDSGSTSGGDAGEPVATTGGTGGAGGSGPLADAGSPGTAGGAGGSTRGATGGAGGSASTSGSGGSPAGTDANPVSADSTGGCSCRMGAGAEAAQRPTSMPLFVFLLLSPLIASWRRRRRLALPRYSWRSAARGSSADARRAG